MVFRNVYIGMYRSIMYTIRRHIYIVKEARGIQFTGDAESFI